MKIRVKQKQGLLALRDKTMVNIVLTDPVQGLLPYLIGRAALFGEDPQIVLARFRLNNAAAILEYLVKAGYIGGVPESWGFSMDVKTQCIRNLGGQQTSLSLGETNTEEPVPLRTLVKLFTRYTKVLEPHQRGGGKVTNMAAGLRLICKKFDSAFVLKQMKVFFENRPAGPYHLEAFAAFLKTAGPRRKTPL